MLRSAQPSQFSTYPSQYIDTPVLAVLKFNVKPFLSDVAVSILYKSSGFFRIALVD